MPESTNISTQVIEQTKISSNGTTHQQVQLKDPVEEIRSDEVQEILSHVPNWMIRWGITLIFGIIILLVFIAWFIQYPDTVQGQAIITTQQPPVKLISKTEGYIEQLYLKDNVMIEQGQMIAEITNPTSKEAIEYLRTVINQDVIPVTIDTNLVFGEIQNEYNNLIKNIKDYTVLMNDNYYNNSIQHISKQISYNKQLASITREQVELMNQELKNAKAKYQTDSMLYAKDYTSKYEHYKNQTELTNKKNDYTNLKKNVVQYQITVTQYEQQKDELIKQHEEEERTLKTNIESNKKNIKSYIESWQQNYTLVAPITGKLSYITKLTTNQYINSQSALFVVIPDNQDYIAYANITTQGYGKVKEGQKVRIKLNNYPYEEYGQLIGEVKEIAQIPNEDNYQVKIQLPEQLTTSYHQNIKYTPEMQGTTEIITEDLRLLERIFNKFRKVLEK
ncbi:MAG: HlyD family efflux transporter periplasmic adaptor subunit [Flavobacteriales bacterium]|nr:HlyD family efflux transporter periplasmic adaptor subunit [Flavobacteriales bacterium]